MDRKEILELVMGRASDIDWMKDSPQFSKKDGVIYYNDMDDRDAIVWVVFYTCDKFNVIENLSERALLELASDIIDNNGDLYCDDLDAITWDIEIGHNFHGLSDDMPEFAFTEEQLDTDEDIVWVKIQCTDWAS